MNRVATVYILIVGIGIVTITRYCNPWGREVGTHVQGHTKRSRSLAGRGFKLGHGTRKESDSPRSSWDFQDHMYAHTVGLLAHAQQHDTNWTPQNGEAMHTWDLEEQYLYGHMEYALPRQHPIEHTQLDARPRFPFRRSP